MNETSGLGAIHFMPKPNNYQVLKSEIVKALQKAEEQKKKI
jgi:FixJ family two-component response regulator